MLSGSALAALWLVAGCRPAELPAFSSSLRVAELSPALQAAVHLELVKHSGEYLTPKMIADRGAPPTDLKRGQAIFQERCVQCHGVSGGGDGPAAALLYPRPRDYRRGLFKFTSTPYGGRPLRNDLLRTVREGIRGTSMPAFNLLPPRDLEAIVDYVVMLSCRGELEEQLVQTAESEEEIDPELVTEDLLPVVINRWNTAEESEVRPLTLRPKFTGEHVTRGRQAFLTKGCSKCHGEDGRGQTLDNRGTDVWGFPTRAADLTSGMLHGGTRPDDIYLRIFNGINGTPMPSFAITLKEEPDTIWDLVAYVTYVSNGRRRGESPTPGPLNPYLPKDAPAP